MVVKFRVVYEDKTAEWRFIDKIDKIDLVDPNGDNDNQLTLCLLNSDNRVIEELEVSDKPSSFDDDLTLCDLRSAEIYILNDNGQTIEKITPNR